MADVVVYDLEIAERVSETGKTYLATFTTDLPGVRIRGCILAISLKNDIVAHPSTQRGQGGPRGGAQVLDQRWRHEMTRQALDCYRFAGGKLGAGLPVFPPAPKG